MHAAPRRRVVRTLRGTALGLTALTTLALTAASAGATSATVAQAKKALLTLSDMPSGWTAAKSSADNGTIPGATQLAKCLGVPRRVIVGSPPTAFSEQFTSQNDLEDASDNVTFYKSAAAAQADFNTLASTKAPSCLTTVFNGPAKKQLAGEFGGGAKVGAVEVSRSPASSFGPGTANVTIFFPVAMKGSTLNVELIISDFITGNKEQTVQLIGIQSPLPATLSKHLTTVADGRI